jgi:hypothetical protein
MEVSTDLLVRSHQKEKTHHIMRFKAPHKCDLEKLVNVSGCLLVVVCGCDLFFL